jgi:hypothetical protein
MKSIRQMVLPCIVVLVSIMTIQAYNTATQHIAIESVAYSQTPVPDPIPSVTPAIAKIKGPSTVLAGTLLFLSADDASGDNFKWLIPEELTQTSAICSNNIFFAIPTPGEYTFGLVAVNKAADIDVAYHKVKVTTHPGNGPPVVDPPKDPPATPIPSFDKVIKTSIEGLEKLKDPTTAANLKLALNLLISEAENKSLQELRIETIRLTSSTFLNRKGESLKKEWGQLWVEPIDAAIIELNLKDAKTYVELLKALVKTL